jgi:hypothetical protein
MNRPVHIYFDTPPLRVDVVGFAVIPVDGITGAIVRSGVTAKIKGLLDRPVLNQSGMLVFINLPDPPYEIEIDATEAGFFGPVTLIHPPPGPPEPDPQRARQVRVLLEPRPDYPFAPATTLVRGVVVRGLAPEEGAEISGTPTGSIGDFTAHSTEKGAFALALRLPPPADFNAAKEVEVKIELTSGPKPPKLVRTLTCKLVRARSHSFEEPIDLTGTNEPKFFPI